MEAPIQQIVSNMRLLISYLSNVCDANQSERKMTNKMCRDFRVILKAKEKPPKQEIDAKSSDLVVDKKMPAESTSVITKSELAAVQSLLDETKSIRKREFKTSTSKFKSQTSLKKEIKSEPALKKKSEISGAIPKNPNNSAETLKPGSKTKFQPQPSNTSKSCLSNEVNKLLKSHEETMKLVQTRLLNDDQLAGRNEFFRRLNIDANRDSESPNQDEMTTCTYTYKDLRQLMDYSRLVYSLWSLQLDMQVYKMLIDIAIPLIKTMNTKDGYFLHLIRCIFAVLKDENTDFPVFLKDNL